MAQTDVEYMRLAAPEVCIRIRPPAGNRLKGQWGDKVSGPAGQDGVDLSAGLGQLAGQVDCLVAGDAARYAQNNACIHQRIHAVSPAPSALFIS